VLLAPVTHPWPGGIAWFYRLASTPVVGPLFRAHHRAAACVPAAPRLRAAVAAPQRCPTITSAAPPSRCCCGRRVHRQCQRRGAAEESVVRQSPRYAEITAPTVIIAGDRDTIVSPEIHSAHAGANLSRTRS
jgi:pimeloyl-ACP methyl ester carboxylesterase